MWLSGIGLAFAAVTVTDPAGCIDRNRLDDELRLLLGDEAVERLEIGVEVTEPVRVRTTVRDEGKTLWSRTTDFATADCPVVPEALALSVQQGLSRIPGWSPTRPPRAPLFAGTFGLAVSGGLPFEGRFGGRVGARITHRSFAVWTQLRLVTGPPFTVGSGTATILHPAVAIGPVLRTAGPWAPEVWMLGSTGPLFAFGSRFDEDRVATLPRVAIELGGAVHPGGPLHVGGFFEIPVVRTRLVETGGLAGRTESALRVGITLGFDFSVPK